MIVDPATSTDRATRKTERGTAFARPGTQQEQIDAAKERVLDWMKFRWEEIKATEPGSTERQALVDKVKQQLKDLVRNPPFGFTSQQVKNWLETQIDDVVNNDRPPPASDVDSVYVGNFSVSADGRLAIGHFHKQDPVTLEITEATIFVISAAAADRFNELFSFPAIDTDWGEEAAIDWLEIYGSPEVEVRNDLPEDWVPDE